MNVRASILSGKITQIKNGISIATNNDIERQRIKVFIEHSYKRYFNAQISVDMPILVAYYDCGQIVGAMGIRPATNNELFLEQYLDSPIETCISHIQGTSIKRNTIVEVGNLALEQKCLARYVIPEFIYTVYSMDFTWCALSATNEIVRLFDRIGLKHNVIASCEPFRIKNDQNTWGTYYHYDPKVIVGNLDDVESRMMLDQTHLYNPHRTKSARE